MSRRLLLCATLAATTLVAGCTADSPSPTPNPQTFAPGALRLVAYDSCDQLTDDLRKAAGDAVGPWGFGNGGGRQLLDGGTRAEAAGSAARDMPAPAAATPAFSGTNIHEQGADEPDIVKTDGRRIVTVAGGRLRVIDAASRKQVGALTLDDNIYQADLLLSGDRALVMAAGEGLVRPEFDGPVRIPDRNQAVYLIDLSGAPRVISRFETGGNLVDARQTGTTARVVMRSAPRIELPSEKPAERPDEDKMLEDNQDAVRKAPTEAWLPEWSVKTGQSIEQGRVSCERVSRPPTYSGTSMVTIFTFDMSAPSLSNGDPVSVVADGDTVYGTPTSLYVASDTRWWEWAWRFRSQRANAETEIYRFDLPAGAKPVYSGAGSVPGWLINQYALSEWEGRLRIATTTDGASARKSSSAIRVLEPQGDRLTQIGIVDGLGKGEQIYSARFIGPRGYVVTFRQTDPLYSVDLSNPAAPKVTGELKITGYSAHVQPVGENRLVGIGQEADTQGRTQGTQVSLFDVADPADPRRLAQHHVEGGNSEAEHDPHAILWWPATKLLVIPVSQYSRQPEMSALALRVTDSGVEEVGKLQQARTGDGWDPQIRRTLVIGDELWTLSDTGMQASSLSTFDSLGTVRF